MIELSNVLWTSGWDSTYRVASLLLVEHRSVQPWYVWDKARRSSKRELATQNLIRQALTKIDPTVAERLLPTIIRPLDEVPTDPVTTEKWRTLRSREFLGRQYDWLARTAEADGVNLELSIHRDDKAHAFLEKSVILGEDGMYQIAKDADDALTLFRQFRFPLFDMTKVDMQDRARCDGFGEIMELTWFCATPLFNGQPCGYCNPCTYTRDEGMGRRVPTPSLARGAQYLILKNFSRMEGRLRMLLQFKRA